MAQKELVLGIIGIGSRIEHVYRNVVKATEGRARILCFYDTGETAQSRVRKLPYSAGAYAAESFREVINNSSVNAIMIGTPNAYHVEPAIHAMKSGKPLYLEKPIATTIEDHNRLLRTERETGSRVILGFVLRYTPFYRKIKELISSGHLGRIMFIQATEHMGITLTADCFLRGWRASREHAGPLLLEKCCHDIDIINWLLQTPCETISALRDCTVFVPREDRPERCGLCNDNTCQYRASSMYTNQTEDETGEQIYFLDYNDYCVYNRRDKDIADHTSLLARYKGGIHVAFNVTMGVVKGERRITIIGSQAQLSGCAEDNKIVLQPLQRDGKVETIVPECIETRGHYGGDTVLVQEFVRLVRNPEATCETNIAAGYESGIVCLAADESCRTQTVIDMMQFRKKFCEPVRMKNYVQ